MQVIVVIAVVVVTKTNGSVVALMAFPSMKSVDSRPKDGVRVTIQVTGEAGKMVVETNHLTVVVVAGTMVATMIENHSRVEMVVMGAIVTENKTAVVVVVVEVTAVMTAVTTAATNDIMGVVTATTTLRSTTSSSTK